MIHTHSRLRVLLAVLGCVVLHAHSHGQEGLSRDEFNQLMKTRWPFVSNRNYPRNADEMRKVIRENAPLEFEVLLVRAGELRESEAWLDARSWYDVLLQDSPDDLEANYGMGIARRELGATEAATARAAAWRPAEKNFQHVIAIDSTYRDTYYQYAILKQYAGDYKRAVELGHRQLEIRPTAQARVGIFRFYDYLLAHEEMEDLEYWLEWRDTWYDAYFTGEMYRRHGQLERAKHFISRAMQQRTRASLMPAYLSLVRLYVQQEEPLLAHEIYWNAVDDVKDAVDRQLLIDDLYMIINENEFAVFERPLQPPVMKRALELFWLRRNPMPADKYNSRLIEHYRRLIAAEEEYRYDGFRHWAYKDDRQNVLQFPPWYDKNYKFNDEGLIFLRYGEPDETSFALTKDDDIVDQKDPLSRMRLDNSFSMDQVEGVAPKLPRSGLSISNMSWLYHAQGNLPKRIFHFTVSDNAPPGYWKLVPGFMEREIVGDLARWDSRYSRILNASGNEVQSVYNEMMQDQAEMVMQSFHEDRHTWPERTEELDMDQLPVRFKESADETLLEVSYAIPLIHLLEEGGGSSGNRLEVGVAVYDERMREVFRDSRLFAVEGRMDSHVWGNHFIDEFQIPLSMDTYNVAMHAKVPQTQRLSGTKFLFPMEGLAGEKLSCSSLKLAFDIHPEDDSEVRDRTRARIVPNPTKQFRKTDPMFAYYEIYNLGYNREGRTDFSVSFELKETGRDRNVFNRVAGFFGGREDYRVSVSNTQSGTERKVTDYISFDMSRLREGSYELSLVVKDNVTGEETSTRAELELL